MLSSIKSQNRKQHKKLTRQNIICYFLAMAQGHQATQDIQQQLFMHPYFNPIVLFKKFTQLEQIRRKDYESYMIHKVKISSISALDAYMRKHQLGKRFDCEQFIASLLPYSPDILRNSYATISWQVKSSPTLKRDILSLFKQLIRIQVYHILNVSSFRKNINLQWKKLKIFIQDDLQKINPNILSQDFTIMTIRKWMQLWIDVHEKDILNAMRWMKGGSQTQMEYAYNNIYVDEVSCSCNWVQTTGIKLKQIPVKQKQQTIVLNFQSKPLTRRESQMYQRRLTYNESQHSNQRYSVISVRNRSLKNRSYSKTQSVCKLTNKSRSRSVKSSCFDNTKKINNSNSTLDQKSKSLWSQYVYTILHGENVLAQKRQILKPYIVKIQEIIREGLMSKKKNITKINKIIKFIDKYTNLTKTNKKLMEDCLSHLSIENQVIISIFTTINNKEDEKNKSPLKHETRNIQLTNKSLKKQIGSVLKNYCLTKCKLIRISQEIIHNGLSQRIFKVLNEKKQAYLTKQNLIEMMNSLNIQNKQGDADILLRHFGDGDVITGTSFHRVFQIQSI